MWMNVLFFTVAIAYVVQSLVRACGLPSWSYYVIVTGVSGGCYLVNVGPIKHFIRKRMPELASPEEVFPGVQQWELTAGLGVVPTWVSWIGLASIASVIALAVPFIVGLLR